MIISDSISDDELRRRLAADPGFGDDGSPEASAAWVREQAARPAEERQAALERADQVLEQLTGRPFDLGHYFPKLKS